MLICSQCLQHQTLKYFLCVKQTKSGGNCLFSCWLPVQSAGAGRPKSKSTRVLQLRSRRWFASDCLKSFCHLSKTLKGQSAHGKPVWSCVAVARSATLDLVSSSHSVKIRATQLMVLGFFETLFHCNAVALLVRCDLPYKGTPSRSIASSACGGVIEAACWTI